MESTRWTPANSTGREQARKPHRLPSTVPFSDSRHTPARRRTSPWGSAQRNGTNTKRITTPPGAIWSRSRVPGHLARRPGGASQLATPPVATRSGSWGYPDGSRVLGHDTGQPAAPAITRKGVRVPQLGARPTHDSLRVSAHDARPLERASESPSLTRGQPTTASGSAPPTRDHLEGRLSPLPRRAATRDERSSLLQSVRRLGAVSSAPPTRGYPGRRPGPLPRRAATRGAFRACASDARIPGMVSGSATQTCSIPGWFPVRDLGTRPPGKTPGSVRKEPARHSSSTNGPASLRLHRPADTHSSGEFCTPTATVLATPTGETASSRHPRNVSDPRATLARAFPAPPTRFAFSDSRQQPGDSANAHFPDSSDSARTVLLQLWLEPARSLHDAESAPPLSWRIGLTASHNGSSSDKHTTSSRYHSAALRHALRFLAT